MNNTYFHVTCHTATNIFRKRLSLETILAKSIGRLREYRTPYSRLQPVGPLDLRYHSAGDSLDVESAYDYRSLVVG